MARVDCGLCTFQKHDRRFHPGVNAFRTLIFRVLDLAWISIFPDGC
jgi:hypothetical protein